MNLIIGRETMPCSINCREVAEHVRGYFVGCDVPYGAEETRFGNEPLLVFQPPPPKKEEKKYTPQKINNKNQCSCFVSQTVHNQTSIKQATRARRGTRENVFFFWMAPRHRPYLAVTAPSAGQATRWSCITLIVAEMLLNGLQSM